MINLEVSEVVRSSIIKARGIVYFENIFSLKIIVYPIPPKPSTFDSSSRPSTFYVEEPRRSKGGSVSLTLLSYLMNLF